MLKKEIAMQMKAKRDALDPHQRHIMTQAIHTRVLKRLEGFQHLAIYASFGSEIDTFRLIEHWLSQGKDVYLPRVTGKTMDFYPIDSIQSLKRSAYGILEPTGLIPVDSKCIEVFVVPLLAYNQRKYRVGYGGGYYDRYLAHTHALKLGMAYTFQYTHVAFEEDFDIALDAIITN